jgi:hypothetical protein
MTIDVIQISNKGINNVLYGSNGYFSRKIHPEILVCGLNEDESGRLLQDIAEQIKKGNYLNSDLDVIYDYSFNHIALKYIYLQQEALFLFYTENLQDELALITRYIIENKREYFWY